MRRPRFRLRTVMILVAVAAMMMASIAWTIHAMDDDEDIPLGAGLAMILVIEWLSITWVCLMLRDFRRFRLERRRVESRR